MNLTGISGYAPVVEIKIGKDGRFLKGKVHSFIQQKGVGPRKDEADVVAKEMGRLSREDIHQNPIRVDGKGNF